VRKWESDRVLPQAGAGPSWPTNLELPVRLVFQSRSQFRQQSHDVPTPSVQERSTRLKHAKPEGLLVARSNRRPEIPFGQPQRPAMLG